MTPSALTAQEEVTAALQGVVRLGDAPVSGGEVVLHRVSTDVAGEIDTVRTDREGAFRFVLPYVPDPETRREVFFVSTRYAGILYFGAPVTTAADLDSVYALAVHDTLSAPTTGASFPVQTRTVFLESTDQGWSVTDLFEVRNDGDRTVVARDGGAVWSYPLFRTATNVELGEGDVNPDAFEVENGLVRISSPVPPGTRLFVFRYEVPDLDAGLALPGVTESVDLLIREPAPLLDVQGLVANQPVEVEPGSVYRRFAGENLQEAMLRFVPRAETPTIPFGVLVVALGLVLGAFGVWGARRVGPTSRTEVLMAVARLDEDWERRPGRSETEARAYRRKRQRLLDRIPE